MGQISVIEGKLYKKGKEVRPQMGNKEHIEAIKKYSEYKEGKFTEVYFEEKYEAEVSIECLCGRNVNHQVITDDDDEFSLDDKYFSCTCGQEYKLEFDMKNDRLLTKLIEE